MGFGKFIRYPKLNRQLNLLVWSLGEEYGMVMYIFRGALPHFFNFIYLCLDDILKYLFQLINTQESRQNGSVQTGDDKSEHRHFRNQ